MFFNELDILECRLRELDSQVDRFVLVESPVTFQGSPKPLYYADNRQRFSSWHDKLIHVIAADLPQGPVGDREASFEREAAQRERTFAGVKDADPDDIILFGDVDEIPNPKIIGSRMWTGITLSMAMHMYAVDWLFPSPWPSTVVQLFKGVTGFQALRDFRTGWPRLQDAGHHFSYLGGPDAIRKKVAAYSHVELRQPVLGLLDEGRLYSDGLAYGIWQDEEMAVQQTPVDVDGSYPKWIRDRECPSNWFRP